MPLCSEKTDLLRCFTTRGDRFQHQISLNDRDKQRLADLCVQIAGLSGFGKDVMQKILFGQILLIVNGLHRQNSRRDGLQEESPGKSRILKLIDIINTNLDGDLRLDSLSCQAGVNKYQLCRDFRRYSGLTIQGYIKMRRIVEAKRLLLEGYSVTDVCGLVGFNDYSHFIRTFSREAGMSPLRFKKKGA
jgi:AraC-like DNA-binding protein